MSSTFAESNPFQEAPPSNEARQPLVPKKPLPTPQQPASTAGGPSYLAGRKSQNLENSSTPSGPSYLSRRKSQNLESANNTPPPRPAKPADVAPARPPKPAVVAPAVPRKDATQVAEMNARRAEELDERERELNAREAALKRLEANPGGAAADPRAPNWPPCLPKKWVYQNFELDIPESVRSRVKMTYYHMFGLLQIIILSLCNVLFTHALFACAQLWLFFCCTTWSVDCSRCLPILISVT